MRLLLTLAAATVLGAVAAFTPGAAGAAAPSTNELRVCADPDYLPFSNRAGAGFENQIASYVAHVLHERLVYTWDSSRGTGGFDQFLRETLDAKKCDVITDVPYASDGILASNAYYVSSYVFVFPKRKHYDITSMDSPVLAHLKIGFETDTPAENGLKLRTLILHGVPFDSTDETKASPSTSEMLAALQSGKIAVGVTWEPAIGMYLRAMPQFEVVAVPNSRSQGSPEQYAFPMAMAARSGDTATKAKLDRVIAQHGTELTRILARNGVRLYAPSDAAAGL
jgi:mxaJ protein